jgi:hypothetical protein
MDDVKGESILGRAEYPTRISYKTLLGPSSVCHYSSFSTRSSKRRQWKCSKRRFLVAWGWELAGRTVYGK